MTATSFYHQWTKKLGDNHYHDGASATTLCGKPMLGNNYSKVAINREECPECTKIAEERMSSRQGDDK